MCFLHLFLPKYLSVVEMILSLITFLSVSDWQCLRTTSQCHSSIRIGKLRQILKSLKSNVMLIEDSPSWGARGARASASTSSRRPRGTRGHTSVWWTENRSHLVPTHWPSRVITDTRHPTLFGNSERKKKRFIFCWNLNLLWRLLTNDGIIIRWKHSNQSSFCRVTTISLSI